MARWANSCSPGVMERCFVVSGMTQMVAGKADCSHCSIVSPNNSGVRLFWTSQLTLHCVIYWTGGALFSWWMAIDSRHQLSIIAAATDLMETAPGHSRDSHALGGDEEDTTSHGTRALYNLFACLQTKTRRKRSDGVSATSSCLSASAPASTCCVFNHFDHPFFRGCSFYSHNIRNGSKIITIMWNYIKTTLVLFQ